MSAQDNLQPVQFGKQVAPKPDWSNAPGRRRPTAMSETPLPLGAKSSTSAQRLSAWRLSNNVPYSKATAGSIFDPTG